MKIVTILGTRPEIIRLSRVIEKLDQVCEHVLVHTGQNHDHNLSQLFFDELGLRAPDIYCGISGASTMERVGAILKAAEMALLSYKPDRLLILGDTDSALAAFAAKRLGVPVFHMEAGNRCYDPRVPEEVNRRVIDHCSDILMPYTENSRENLLREGFGPARVIVTGNPILEVIRSIEPKIAASKVLSRLGLTARKFLLATFHRAENVDVEERLRNILTGLARLAAEIGLPTVVSCHPRTRNRLEALNLINTGGLIFIEPLGLADFVALEQAAACVLTDSGTVQEECAIFNIPNVILRDVTERPETVECGSAIIAGTDPDKIIASARAALSGRPRWQPPPEYMVENVSDVAVRIVTSQYDGLPVPFGYHA